MKYNFSNSNSFDLTKFISQGKPEIKIGKSVQGFPIFCDSNPNYSLGLRYET